MKFFLSLSLFSALALLATGAQARLAFEQLQVKCQGDIIIVGEYEGGIIKTYVPNECAPYRLRDGTPAVQLHICRTLECYPYPNPDCTGNAVPPVSLVIPASTPLLNAADIVSVIEQGVTCQYLGIL